MDELAMMMPFFDTAERLFALGSIALPGPQIQSNTTAGLLVYDTPESGNWTNAPVERNISLLRNFGIFETTPTGGTSINREIFFTGTAEKSINTVSTLDGVGISLSGSDFNLNDPDNFPTIPSPTSLFENSNELFMAENDTIYQINPITGLIITTTFANGKLNTRSGHGVSHDIINGYASLGTDRTVHFIGGGSSGADAELCTLDLTNALQSGVTSPIADRIGRLRDFSINQTLRNATALGPFKGSLYTVARPVNNNTYSLYRVDHADIRTFSVVLRGVSCVKVGDGSHSDGGTNIPFRALVGI